MKGLRHSGKFAYSCLSLWPYKIWRTKYEIEMNTVQSHYIVFPPALKKGMVSHLLRLLKRALLTRGNMSKGHFQRATASQRAIFLSGPWLARRAHFKHSH